MVVPKKLGGLSQKVVTVVTVVTARHELGVSWGSRKVVTGWQQW